MFKLTRDSAGRLVVICEVCGATHLDAPHDRNTAWQRTHADEHRRQRPRKGVGKGPLARRGPESASVHVEPPERVPEARSAISPATTQKESNDVRH